MREDYCRKAVEALKEAVRSYYMLYMVYRREALEYKRQAERYKELYLQTKERLDKLLEFLLGASGKELGRKANVKRLLDAILDRFHVDTVKVFIDELKRHGLLRLAKRYLEKGDLTLTRYLSEDGILMVHMYSNRILEEPDKGDAPRPRRMLWIC